jgi:hypothetical protein
MEAGMTLRDSGLGINGMKYGEEWWSTWKLTINSAVKKDGLQS